MPQLTLHFPKGVLVRLSATFTDADDALADPGTVTFRTLAPSGSPAEQAFVYGVTDDVVRDSIGVYHLDVDADVVGTWWYRVEGAGSLQAVAEHSFIVDTSHF